MARAFDKAGAAFRNMGAFLLAVLITFGLTPIGTAYAANELVAASMALAASPTAASLLSFAETDNLWDHDYTVWSRPSLSYLNVSPNGSLERIEDIYPDIIIETVSPDLKGVISSKTLPQDTYWTSTASSSHDVVFGSFFSGSTYNYIVTGQHNPDERNDIATYRITKYTKEWQYVAHTELYGANTYEPFSSGGCDCSEMNGQLIVRTCHKMYDSGGIRHQANMTIIIDESTMNILEHFYYSGNIRNSLGYVSHSFNQYAATLNENFYGIDHGDSYPRGIVVKKIGFPDNYNTFYPIAGQTGNNYTGTALGGVETSATTNKLLIAGNSVTQSLFTGGNENSLTRNIWVASIDPDVQNASIKQLTQYADEQNGINVTNPFIVKVDENRFLVLWSIANGFEYTTDIEYCFVDGNGNRLTENQKTSGLLSDCQPIVYNGKVIWYAGHNCSPVFCSIDLASGQSSITATFASVNFAVHNSGVIYEPGYGYRDMSIWYRHVQQGLSSVATAANGLVNLVEGQDYTMSYEIDTENKACHVLFTGMGAYAGQSSSLDLHIISEYMTMSQVSDIAETEFTGNAIVPDPVLTNRDGGQMTKDVDYTVTVDADSDKVGYHTATFTGKGFYYGVLTKTFRVVQKNFSDIVDITFDPAEPVYDGTDKLPDVIVELDGKRLVENTDYRLDYTPRADVGPNTVRVMGIGNYCGFKDKTYTIKARSVADATITPIGTWDEIVVKATVDGRALEKDKDFTANVDKTSVSGKAIITVEGKGNYTGTARYEATPESVKVRVLEGATVTLPQARYEYIGTDIKPSPTVVLDGETLVENVDYAVSYQSNRLPGKATMTITGINGTAGTVTKDFYIVIMNTFRYATIELPETTYTYTGSPITPEPIVWFEGEVKTRDVDYTVSYRDNTGIGSATVVVTGINAYDGVATETFVIDYVSLAKATVKVPHASYTYTGKAITPAPTVMLDGKTLRAGTDYSVGYSGNTAAGTATVTVSGTGIYKGQAKTTFKIAYSASRKANPMKVTAKKNPLRVSYSKLKKGKVTLSRKTVFNISKAQGAVTFQKKSGSGKLSITKAGKVSVKKGAKKGTYSMKVNVKAAGNDRYRPAVKKVAVKVKVR